MSIRITTTNVSRLHPGDVVRGLAKDGSVTKVTSWETEYAPAHVRNAARIFRVSWIKGNGEQGRTRVLGATNVEVAR